ncbi:MAG: hypothetical protein K2X86_07195 [Cytophagaceae bacterium]|nr:hypothetical protein [Cytophagaceae bacterium]
MASRLLGFFVAMWAAKLIGVYFESPGFKNLWGLNSHKMLVSKETLENLTWIAQVLIGFFVFEIMHKTLFQKATELAPQYYKKGMEYLEQNGITEKARNLKLLTINKVKEKAIIGKEKVKELADKYSKASN